MKKIPTLRRRKSTGHAYARFNGEQRWFGLYDDQETQERFLRTAAEWTAAGYHLQDEKEGLTVEDVAARYLEPARPRRAPHVPVPRAEARAGVLRVQSARSSTFDPR